jgi:hypothetical protein
MIARVNPLLPNTKVLIEHIRNEIKSIIREVLEAYHSEQKTIKLEQLDQILTRLGYTQRQIVAE